MAHFARLDENNVVIDVAVVPDAQEHRGEAFMRDDLGLGGRWVQTSYNNNIRRRFAGIGMTYDPVNDVFIQRKEFGSWTLDENFDWQPPKPLPKGNRAYVWDESVQDWVLASPGGG